MEGDWVSLRVDTFGWRPGWQGKCLQRTESGPGKEDVWRRMSQEATKRDALGSALHSLSKALGGTLAISHL